MQLIKNNISIYQEGDPSKRTIIFVHGFPYDHSMWNDQVKFLSSSYNCISYDIRGLGESPAGDGQFTMESFVDDLEFIIDELKPVKPILCGLSMGGYLSFRAVERMESRFGGVIFCDTKPEADNNDGKLKRAASIKKINTGGLAAFVKDFVPNCFAESSVKKMRKQYENIIAKSSSFDPAGVKGCLLAMIGRNDTSGYLPNIKIPVLVLCGEKDKLTPVGSMKNFAGKIPGSKFVVISEAGHMTPIENPLAVNKAIKEFMDENFSK